ncbi:MAG: GNAT family N-acetyltransferase [Alphaproteobacteria bacterium]
MKIIPRLIIPDLAHVPSYVQALKEGHRCGGGAVATADHVLKTEAYPQAFLDELFAPKPPTWINEKGEEVERVPQTTVWLVDNDTFIGDAKIRHRLNDRLLQSGGHIGYGVRPSMRRKGYATEMLRLCLIWARDNLNLDKALLSCVVDNEASARVMEKNGGQLIDITPHPWEVGKMQKRYWVPVPRT